MLSILRLHRALGLFGVDVDAYLHRRSVVDIESQLRACVDCGATGDCDVALEQGKSADFEFCPNRDTLTARQGSRGPAGGQA